MKAFLLKFHSSQQPRYIISSNFITHPAFPFIGLRSASEKAKRTHNNCCQIFLKVLNYAPTHSHQLLENTQSDSGCPAMCVGAGYLALVEVAVIEATRSRQRTLTLFEHRNHQHLHLRRRSRSRKQRRRGEERRGKERREESKEPL